MLTKIIRPRILSKESLLKMYVNKPGKKTGMRKTVMIGEYRLENSYFNPDFAQEIRDVGLDNLLISFINYCTDYIWNWAMDDIYSHFYYKPIGDKNIGRSESTNNRRILISMLLIALIPHNKHMEELKIYALGCLLRNCRTYMLIKNRPSLLANDFIDNDTENNIRAIVSHMNSLYISRLNLYKSAQKFYMDSIISGDDNTEIEQNCLEYVSSFGDNLSLRPDDSYMFRDFKRNIIGPEDTIDTCTICDIYKVDSVTYPCFHLFCHYCCADICATCFTPVRFTGRIML